MKIFTAEDAEVRKGKAFHNVVCRCIHWLALIRNTMFNQVPENKIIFFTLRNSASSAVNPSSFCDPCGSSRSIQ